MYRRYKVRSRKYKRKYRKYKRLSKRRNYKTRRIAKKALYKATKTQSLVPKFSYQQTSTLTATTSWQLIPLMRPGDWSGNPYWSTNTVQSTALRALHTSMTMRLKYQTGDLNTISGLPTVEPNPIRYTIAILQPTQKKLQDFSNTTGSVPTMTWKMDWAGDPDTIHFNPQLWKVLWKFQGTSGAALYTIQGVSELIPFQNPVKNWKFTVKTPNAMMEYPATGGSASTWANGSLRDRRKNLYLAFYSDNSQIDNENPQLIYDVIHNIQSVQ